MMRKLEEVVVRLDIEQHPSLELATWVAHFPQPLSASESPDWLQALLKPDAATPVQRTEECRAAVRDMLRHGGYKPTGRGKPASEYLVKVAAEGRLGSINTAVDIGNAVSLHSGVPVSVVDLDLTKSPLRVAIAGAGSRFVFNSAGHEIDVSGLLCLHDAEGPCANAVKDSMRTKTRLETQRLLCVVWGVQGKQPATQAIAEWYRQLLERAGATVE